MMTQSAHAVMPRLRRGDVVVTAGTKGWQSKLIVWFTNTPWTHVFIVESEQTLLESYFPVGVERNALARRFAEMVDDGETYRVLRYPGLTPTQADAVVATAQKLLGRKYDVLQVVLYGLFRVFLFDGPLRVICSRFITAAFAGAGLECFPAVLLTMRLGRVSRRYDELRKGWCTPEDLLVRSALCEVHPHAD